MPSDSRQSRREAAGFALLIGIAALCMFIFFLDNIRKSLQSSFEVVALFKEAPRLRKGSIVWVAGQQVGRVISVNLRPPSRDTTAPRVAVVLELATSAKPMLRSDSRLRLTSPRLMGEPVVEIDPGSTVASPIKEGDTLRSRVVPPKTEALIAEAKDARASLDSLMRESKGLRARFGTRTAQMARVRHEAALASADLAKLQYDMDNGALTKLLSDPQRSAAISRVQANAAAISDAIQQAQERAAKASRDAGPAREQLTRHITQLQQQLTALQKMIDNPNGVYGRMQRDSALTKAVRGAQAQLDSLMTESKKNPLRFWF
jgi:ABC-type transporter Mla subunit MlaD